MINMLLASVMLAATEGLMTSCATDDNPATSGSPSESVIKEKIVGKWKAVTQDGSELATNGRTVLTFNADGTRTVSKSYYDTDTKTNISRNKQTGTYTIEGNQLKSYLDEADLYDVVIYNIDAISSNEMTMTMAQTSTAHTYWLPTDYGLPSWDRNQQDRLMMPTSALLLWSATKKLRAKADFWRKSMRC